MCVCEKEARENWGMQGEGVRAQGEREWRPTCDFVWLHVEEEAVGVVGAQLLLVLCNGVRWVCNGVAAMVGWVEGQVVG